MFFERLFFVVSRMNEDESFAKFLLDFFFSTKSYHFFDLLSFLTYCLVAFVLGLFYHEHFSSQLTFYDFSRGQGRSLLFYDARFNKVQEAVAIENLQMELLETVDPSGKYAQMVRKAAEDGNDSE